MRARLLVVSALAALACAVAAPAHAAATPCWKKVFNEWSRTNKIAATYPLHCYHEALSHLKDFPDADIYSSFADDVRSALAAAVARKAHKELPAKYVKQLKDAKKPGKTGTRPASTLTRTTSTAPKTSSTRTTAIEPTGNTDGTGGGGIPTPLLVLGAIALVLLAAGGVGGAIRFNRARRGA